MIVKGEQEEGPWEDFKRAWWRLSVACTSLTEDEDEVDERREQRAGGIVRGAQAWELQRTSPEMDRELQEHSRSVS